MSSSTKQVGPGRPALGPGRGRRAPVVGFRADPEELARIEYIKASTGLPDTTAVMRAALLRMEKSLRKRGNG